MLLSGYAKNLSIKVWQQSVTVMLKAAPGFPFERVSPFLCKKVHKVVDATSLENILGILHLKKKSS